jgi:hypothetical protein
MRSFRTIKTGKMGEHMRRVLHAPERAERNFDHKGAKRGLPPFSAGGGSNQAKNGAERPLGYWDVSF